MGNHVMDSFVFESGQILEDVNVEYYISGIPQYDDDGNIVNAIVYCPNLYGGNSIMIQYDDLVKNHNFNKDEYFFIRIFSLGIPGSCSPSSTGLKYNFPQYTFKDRVNFKRQFLAEKFNIKKVLGLAGEGIGGFEVFTWASEYPDEMDFIIVLNSSFKTYAHRYIFVKCVEAMIESSDDFYSNNYSSSFSMLSVAISRLLFAGFYNDEVLEKLSKDEIDALMDDYVDGSLFVDIHDFKSRNDCILTYDVEDKLQNIKSKALILGVEGYLFFNPEKDVVPLEKYIDDSKVVVFSSKKENYYDEDDFSDIVDEIISFLEQFKNKS